MKEQQKRTQGVRASAATFLRHARRGLGGWESPNQVRLRLASSGVLAVLAACGSDDEAEQEAPQEEEPTPTPTPTPTMAPATTASPSEPERTNTPPTLHPNANLEGAWRENAHFNIELNTIFQDADNDELTYSLRGDDPPAGITINQSTLLGIIRNDALLGTHTLTVEAHDGEAGYEARFTLSFHNTNDAPFALGSVGALAYDEDERVFVDLVRGNNRLFGDDDTDDQLTVTATGLPEGLSLIDPGVLSGRVVLDQEVRTHNVTFVATDTSGKTAELVIPFTIRNTNDAPVVLHTVGSLEIKENDPVSIALDTGSEPLFTDHDTDDILTYQVHGLPVGLAYDADLKAIVGVVTDDRALGRPYRVTVQATDLHQATAEQSFDLTLVGVNDVPVVGEAIPSRLLRGNAETFELDLEDPENPFFLDSDPDEELTYEVSGLALLGFTFSDGVISGRTAHASQNGTHILTVTATDTEGAQAVQTFTLDIQGVSSPPQLIASLSKEFTDAENDPISREFWRLFFDPEGDPIHYRVLDAPPLDAASSPPSPPGTTRLTYDADTGRLLGSWLEPDGTVSTAPTGLQFDGAMGLLTGRVENDRFVATHTLTLEASDGKADPITSLITLTITNVNDAPEGYLAIPILTFDEEVTFSLDLFSHFSDDDIPFHGDVLAFSGTGLLPEMTLDAGELRVYVPDRAYEGITGMTTLTATDLAGATAELEFDYVVTDLNDNPEILPTAMLTVTVTENDAVTVTLADIFFDNDGDVLDYAVPALETGRALEGLGLTLDAGNGLITGSITDDSFVEIHNRLELRAADWRSTTVTTLTLFVENVNDPPEVNPAFLRTYGFRENHAFAVTLDGLFIDVDRGDTLVYATVSDLTALGLSFDPATRELTGLITDDSLVGVHTLEFEATDTSGAMVSESITLTITNVDDAPRLIATPTLSYRFLENDAFTITLSDIFEDPEGDPFVSVASTSPVPLFDPGTAIPVGWAGLVTDDALVGVHTITLTAVSRPHRLAPALSSEATVTLELVNVNDPPRVLASFSRAWTVQENDLIDLDWSGAFTDDDAVHGDTLTYRLTGDVLASPEIAPSAGNTGLTGRIRDDAYVGVHELTYEATDTSGVTTTVTVTLTVANVDDLPEVVPGAVVSYSFAENDSFEIELGDLFSDDDNDRIQSISFTSLHTPPPVFINLTTGLGRLEPGGAAVRGQVFDDDKVGTHTIELTAETAPGPTVSTTLTITITPVNDPPMVNPALTNPVFEENASFELALDELFSDPDTLIYGTKSIDIPLGSLDADPGGDYRFIVLDPGTAMERDALQIQVSDDAKLGRHTLSVSVTDVDGSMAVATLTIDITNVNDVPVLDPTALRNFSVLENADFTQDLTGLFTDDDIGDSFTYRLIAPPAGIGVGLNATSGVLSGTIEDGATFGGDNFLTVEIEDAAGATARATITLDVTPVNDAPEPVPGTVFERTVNENAAINLDLSVLFQDEESDPLTFAIDDSMGPMLAAYGLAIDPVTGLLTGMVTDDTYVRDLELSLEVSDGMLSVSQVLTLTVVNVNDVPRLTGGMTIVAFDENDSETVDFSTLFIDDDIPFHGDTLTYALLGMVIETMSLDRDTGIVVFSITDDRFVGSNTLTLRAEDTSGAGVQATLTVNVANVNDIPEVNPTFDVNNTVTLGDASVWTWDLEDLILDDDRADTLNLQITGGTLPTGLALVSTPMHQIEGMVPGTVPVGMHTLTVQGTDGAGAMASATITLSVEPPNRPPVVTTPIMDRSILQTGSLLIPLVPHFSDPDGDPLLLSLEGSWTRLSINGANELEAMGTVLNKLPDGVYTVTVRANDGDDDVRTSFTLTVEVDDAPGITTTFPDQNLRAFGFTLSPNSFFSTETGDTLTYSVTRSGDSLTSFRLDTTTAPANPALEIDPDLARIHDFGTETYTVTAEDSVGQTTLERFTVSTNSINLPVLTPPTAGSTQRQLGFHIRGNEDAQNWGEFVRGLGDFDGDGDEDFLVGLASSLGGMRTGAVVYGMDFSGSADPDFGMIESGPPPRRVLDLDTYRSSDGALLEADRPFASANSAGDIDGDGLPDLIFGNQEFTSSDVQVVLGRTATFSAMFAPNAVGSSPGQGFRIERTDPTLPAAQFGTYVGSVGDINGDGIGDFAVLASRDDVGGLADAGRAYILYGMASYAITGVDVTLGASLTPDQGFVLSGTQANHRFGYVDGRSGHQTPIAGAGDFNGDGLQDLVVGYPRFENGGMEVGAAYLIYGRQDVVRRDLPLGTISPLDGFRITGEPGFGGAATFLGWSVAGLGDINGDGYDDIGIGERGGIATTNLGSRSFIIFGRPTAEAMNYDVDAGIAASDDILRLTSSGGRIASAGDVNGDGLADVLLGRPQEDASYLIFGMSTWPATRQLHLSPDLDASIGLRIQGGGMDQSGFSVASAGDIDKDGFDDLIIGAPTHNNDGVVTRRTATGGAYVVYGHPEFGSVDETDGGTLVLSDARSFGSAGGTSLEGTQTRTVIYAGAGDDTIVVETLGTDYRIDGGTGDDTLVLRGPGPHFIDLVDPESRYRLTSIERIEVENDPSVMSSVFIRLDYQAILDLSEQRNDFPDSSGSTVDPRGKFLFILDVPSLDVSAMPANPIHDVTLLLEEGIGGIPWTDAGITLNDSGGNPIDYLDVHGRGNALIAFPKHVSSATTRTDPSTRGLSPLSGFLIPGEAGEDEFGASLARLGDVNGDGIDDFVVGAPGADSGGGHMDAGKAYVLFGKTGPRLHLDVGMLAASEGFIIQGDRDNDNLGASVRSAGDFNGDGLQDILVGAPEGDDGLTNSGEVYLIYGQVPVAVSGTPPLLDLSSLAPARGFVIQGDESGEKLGTSATGIGDINGDGYDDLVLGAPDNDTETGIAYVIFGREASPGMYPGMLFDIRNSDGERGTAGGSTPRQVLDLDGFTSSSTTGFTIKGQDANNKTGASVAGLGDINGDGLDDFAVAAPGNTAAPPGGSTPRGGRVAVIYGGTSSASVDLSSGTIDSGRGFLFIGPAGIPEDFGYAVSSAGDINGDGLDDILVGSPKENPLFAGSAYVLFGQAGTGRGHIDAAALGADGFKIHGGPIVITEGSMNNDEVGIDVASAGDVNGDGLADVIVGSHLRDAGTAYFGGLSNSGAAFVMYGMQTGFGAAVDIDTLVGTGTTGFSVYGGAHNERLGKSVAGAGDINGDGYDDLLIASPEHGNFAWGRADQGRVAVIYGMHARDGSTEPSGGRFTAMAGEDTLLGTAGDDVLVGHGDTEAIYGGAGQDRLEIRDSTIRRVDGGHGLDTLVAGVGVSPTLTGAGARAAFRNLETVSLTDASNLLTLNAQAVFDIAGTGSNQEGLADAGETYLRIMGSSGMLLLAEGIGGTGGWVETNDVLGTADQYQLDRAILLVDDGVTVLTP